MEEKKDRFYNKAMLIITTILITFTITTATLYCYFVKTDKGNLMLLNNMELSDTSKELDKKIEILKKYLEECYIGELDSDNMIEYAIKGYVAGLGDVYTSYLTKDEYDDLLIDVKGDYVGIGIYMYTNSDGNIVILSAIEGSPAEKAGLKEEDVIITIDGENCAEMDAKVASSKIKGEAGTTVELEILRGNEKIKKVVERRKVDIPNSRSEILEGNIGYIELSMFDENCSEKIIEYINEFNTKNVKSVIIDLRNNTGGVVSEAIKFSEIFVNKGDIIMRTYNKKDKETIIKSEEDKKTNMKVIVLVNEYSASATEIVSAALKDNKAATIVGKKTYGKGVMQEIMPLPFFEGVLKVTIEEFKTPNGDKINKEGIIPDIEIEDDLETKEDEQLKKAIELCK